MTDIAIQRALQEVEPRLLLVASRHLARLINRRRDRGEPTPLADDILHRVTRDELLDDDLLRDRLTDGPPGDRLIALEPDDLGIHTLPRDRQLRFYWRMLLAERIEANVPHEATVEPAELAEAKAILELDRRIPADATDDDVRKKYIALATTRAVFEPDTLPLFYPLIPDAAGWIGRWSAVLAIPEWLSRTRPAGAAEAVMPTAKPPLAAAAAADPANARAQPSTAPADLNLVRAALDRQRAGDAEAAQASLRALLESLRPHVAIGDADRLVRDWAPLLPLAASGDWPHAKRLLADLQTLSLDLAGDLYLVDLPGSILSMGRKPVRRKLTLARNVLRLRKLMSGRQHLDRSHLGESDEHRIAVHLDGWIETAEAEMRSEIGPVLEAALGASGIHPAGVVETVARDAVVQDWLDKLGDRGFLRFGDVRDAIAKYDLKLPDLAGIREWWSGDALLRLDRRLKDDLDSLYHPAEVYLRWFQRASSLGFGNRAGRWATRYLILPFLGAFLLLESLQHVLHALSGLSAWMSKILAPKPRTPPVTATPTVTDMERVPPAPPGNEVVNVDDFNPFDFQLDFNPTEAATVVTQAVTAAPPDSQHGIHLVTWPAVIGVGFVLMALLHGPAFRSWTFRLTGQLWRLIVAIVYDLPIAIWNAPAIRSLRNHPISKFLYRRFSTAAALTVMFASGMWLLGARPKLIAIWALFAFVWMSIFAWTRIGRWFEDRTSQLIGESWRMLSVNLIPGFIALCADLFRTMLGMVERWLYAVDEWFRFRSPSNGPVQSGYAGKALLSLLWFPIAYLVRFSFYLLIEPQVNPIKHFPVVTVSHKVLLPTIPWFSEVFKVSKGLVLGVVWCIPGVFGFLAWEFLANWKLYRASRSRTLRPLAIGHHGESIRGFLRPGFHSGTLPKLFRKIRKAARKAERSGTALDRHRFDHDRHHVELAVKRFVERQLIDLLEHANSHETRNVVGVATSVRTVRVTLSDDSTLTWTFDGDRIRQSASGGAFDGLAARAGCEVTVDREEWIRTWNSGPKREPRTPQRDS
jgi:hypothetical protein